MEPGIACDQNEQMSVLMSLALDGMLPAAEDRQLQEHLATCRCCQTEWEAMRAVSALFESAPVVGPPLGFAMRVERQLEWRERRRKRTFGSVAVLTSSLSLAGMTIVALAIVALGVIAWQSPGMAPAVEQGTGAAVQIASGMGLVGRVASFFLKDLLLRYGVPVVLTLAVSLALLTGVWAWLFAKSPGSAQHNRYA